MKKGIVISIALLTTSFVNASVSTIWSGLSPEDAARWLAQTEERFVPFSPDDSKYLRTSGLSASANLELITDGFRLNYSTLREESTGITLSSLDEGGNLSFSRTISVEPLTRDRNGTPHYLYTEEFLLTQEELFPFVDQPLELVALYENFNPVLMEANVSAIPEPNSSLLIGMSALLVVAFKIRSRQWYQFLSRSALQS